MKTSEHPSKRKKRGRATLLNPQLQRKICGLMAQGHTVSAACGAVGIGERTFYEWREKHPHFSQATSRAIGQSKIALVDKVRQSDDWRAQAFLLERRWPTEFGKTEARVVQPGNAPAMDAAVNYGSTAVTLRDLLVQTRDEAKINALRLILAEVEAEDARLSRLIEDLRTQGLLL
jgi:Bacteriophage Sf6, terminase small subunit-like